MLRIHVHVTTDDLRRSVTHYSLLLGAPVVEHPDYAKWEPADLPVVFAVSSRHPVPRLDHLGIKADTEDELAPVLARLEAAGAPRVAQAGAECCYARADKVWATDPNGLAWELYTGTGSIETFGEDRRPEAAAACCQTEARPPLIALRPKPA